MPDPRRGEVWLAYTSGQPADPHEPRFVLVVSTDIRNRARDHVVVVPIFSTGTLGPTRLPIPACAMTVCCFCEELTTIDKQFLQDAGPRGRVAVELLDQVVLAVRRAFGRVSSEGRHAPSNHRPHRSWQPGSAETARALAVALDVQINDPSEASDRVITQLTDMGRLAEAIHQAFEALKDPSYMPAEPEVFEVTG